MHIVVKVGRQGITKTKMQVMEDRSQGGMVNRMGELMQCVGLVVMNTLEEKLSKDSEWEKEEEGSRN